MTTNERAEAEARENAGGWTEAKRLMNRFLEIEIADPSENDPDEFPMLRARHLLQLVSEETAALEARVRDLESRQGRRNDLQRRLQSAESGLKKALDDKYTAGGPSLGRALANSAATMYRARAEKFERIARDLVDCASMAPGCKNYNVIVDEAREALGGGT